LKVAVIIYHKNASTIYEKDWIYRCLKSISDQTYEDFDTFELNYGDDDKSYTFETGSNLKTFISKPMKNHIEAMNYLIDICLEDGYDVIFNTNLDDYYTPDRFAKQILAIQNGAQLVSSNFNYFTDERGIFKRMDMARYGNIGIQLRRGHNVLAHPVIAYHKSFFDGGLRYNDLIGYEDKDLWQRASKLEKKMVILPDYLLNYRIHENQITKTHKA